MMEEGKPRFQSGPAEEESPLGDRESRVLEELAREQGAQVAFQGLRRKLDLHQETLSRTLRRLERDGLVEKEETGYRLTPGGAAALRVRDKGAVENRPLTVVEAILPHHIGPEEVAAQLSHRWFRGLRWYGTAESAGGVALTWLSEAGGFAVRLRVWRGRLALEVGGAGQAGPDPSRGFAEARGILAAIAELYGLACGAGGAAGAMTLGAAAGTAG